MGSSVPYEEMSVELTEEQLARLEVKLFPSEDDPHEVVVVGPCPRCEHTSRFVDPLDRLRSVRAEARARQRKVTVLCRCEERHADPSDEKNPRRNCGAAFALDVAWGE